VPQLILVQCDITLESVPGTYQSNEGKVLIKIHQRLKHWSSE